MGGSVAYALIYFVLSFSLLSARVGVFGEIRVGMQVEKLSDRWHIENLFTLATVVQVLVLSKRGDLSWTSLRVTTGYARDGVKRYGGRVTRCEDLGGSIISE